jgi:SagB-type dehydrogenase family enzyme
MTPPIEWLRRTELDRIRLPEMAALIAGAETDPPPITPRRYPGYPTITLPRTSPRWRPSLDRVLRLRRSERTLSDDLPDAKTLSRLLSLAHGISGDYFAGPTPSAGGLQALELYLTHWQPGWLPVGVYHYDRRAHALAGIRDTSNAAAWRECIPSLAQVEGGSLVFVLVGDAARVVSKYCERGERFLLLEAGHLMQNLCLAAVSLGLSVVPLGGFMEGEIARELRLKKSDAILYTGVSGITRR